MNHMLDNQLMRTLLLGIQPVTLVKNQKHIKWSVPQHMCMQQMFTYRHSVQKSWKPYRVLIQSGKITYKSQNDLGNFLNQLRMDVFVFHYLPSFLSILFSLHHILNTCKVTIIL